VAKHSLADSYCLLILFTCGSWEPTIGTIARGENSKSEYWYA
jgi:hypothetical protein